MPNTPMRITTEGAGEGALIGMAVGECLKDLGYPMFDIFVERSGENDTFAGWHRGIRVDIAQCPTLIEDSGDEEGE